MVEFWPVVYVVTVLALLPLTFCFCGRRVQLRKALTTDIETVADGVRSGRGTRDGGRGKDSRPRTPRAARTPGQAQAGGPGGGGAAGARSRARSVNRRGGPFVAESTALPAGPISLSASRHWSRASRPDTPRSGGLSGVAEDMVLDTSSSRTSKSGTTVSTPRSRPGSKGRSRTNSGRVRRSPPRTPVYGNLVSPYAAIPPEVHGGAEEPDYFLMPEQPALMPGAADAIVLGGVSPPLAQADSSSLRTRSLSDSIDATVATTPAAPRGAPALPRHVVHSPRRRSRSIGSLPVVQSVAPTPRRPLQQ